jgi:hypothetical protein
VKVDVVVEMLGLRRDAPLPVEKETVSKRAPSGCKSRM